jgi:hypothetical protein
VQVDFRALAISCFALFLSLGCLLVPLATLGFLAGHREDRRLLACFQYAAPFLALAFVAVAVLAAVTGATELGPFIDQNCRRLVQFGARDFFKAVAPGISCDKYC